MNWEALGAFAELGGAVGVISSLIYLATQIRGQNVEYPAVALLQLGHRFPTAGLPRAQSPEITSLYRDYNVYNRNPADCRKSHWCR